jgi:hypothetical protein
LSDAGGGRDDDMRDADGDQSSAISDDDIDVPDANAKVEKKSVKGA